jgi:hypothetical protein
VNTITAPANCHCRLINNSKNRRSITGESWRCPRVRGVFFDQGDFWRAIT